MTTRVVFYVVEEVTDRCYQHSGPSHVSDSGAHGGVTAARGTAKQYVGGKERSFIDNQEGTEGR